MGRFATHEDEVDDLFRRGVFVDLYRVVRQGLRAGVESYSIKRLEPMIGFERQVDLDEATEHLITFESALEEGGAAEDRDDPGGGGRLQRGRLPGDARPAGLARARRVELAQKLGEPLPRPVGRGGRGGHRWIPRWSASKGALLAGVPDDPAERSERGRGPRRCWPTCSSGTGERPSRPGGATSGCGRCRVPSSSTSPMRSASWRVAKSSARSSVRSCDASRFPPQEHGFGPGDTAQDPVSNKGWTVVGVDEEQRDDRPQDRKATTRGAPCPAPSSRAGRSNTKNLEARCAGPG